MALGSLGEAGIGHLEDADFGCGAEAVFDAADEAVGVVAVAFKCEDSIDHVFEYAWASQGALLGDMADHDDGGACGFGDGDELGAALADLCDAAWGGVDLIRVEHLDGVDDHDSGSDVLGLLKDAREVGVGEDVQGVSGCSGDIESLCAGADLSGGFFT